MVVVDGGSKELPGADVVADAGETAGLIIASVREEVYVANRLANSDANDAVAVCVDGFNVCCIARAQFVWPVNK